MYQPGVESRKRHQQLYGSNKNREQRKSEAEDKKYSGSSVEIEVEVRVSPDMDRLAWASITSDYKVSS